MRMLTQVKLKTLLQWHLGKFSSYIKELIISSNHDTEIITALNACSMIASTLLLNLLTLCPRQPFSFKYTDGYFLYKAAHEEVLLKKYSYSNYFMKLNHHLRWRNKWSFVMTTCLPPPLRFTVATPSDQPRLLRPPILTSRPALRFFPPEFEQAYAQLNRNINPRL